MTYVATFYTHAAALLSHRALTRAGYEAHMMPVPRALSSSCGTCVRYAAPDPMESLLDRDVEQIAEEREGKYTVIKTFA